MRMTKRLLSILLCVVMAVTAFTVTVSAAGSTNVWFTVGKTEVNVDDTFTVSFSNYAMTVKGFSAGFTFDNTLLECVSIAGPNPSMPTMYYLSMDFGGMAFPTVATSVSTLEKANENGTVGFAYIGTADTNYMASVLLTVTFRAKAAGTASFTLYEETNGTDAFKSDSIETQIVTIKGAAPVCTHTTTKTTYENNGNGTHTATVTCTDTCKEVVDTKTEGHDFTGNKDCVCGEKYVPAHTHSFTTVSGTPATCTNYGTKDYYVCSCGYYADAEGNVKIGDTIDAVNNWLSAGGDNGGLIEKEDHGYNLGFRYTSDGVGTNTHTKYCSDCGNAIEGEKNIACEDASGDNNHACDANCGNTSVTAHAPEADDGDCTTPVKCTECGTETTAAKTHVAGEDDGDCTTPVKCVNCSKNAIEAKTHSDKGNDGDHKCDVCGKDGITSHVGGTATCNEQAVCTECGQSYGELDSDKHEETTNPFYENNGDGTHKYWIGCWQCNTKLNLIKENDPCNDSYDDAGNETPDGKCDCCDAVMHTCTLTHVEAKVATCSATGNKEYWYCSDETCGKYYSDADGKNEITDKTSVTIPVDANNHGKTKGFRFDPVDDTYHNSHCLDCDKVVENSKVTHDYTTGEDPYTCICGAKFTGWENKCYIKDAVVLKGWNEIEGYWYYLDSTTGVRAEGLARVAYPKAAINDVTYAPNQEDVTYHANKKIAFKDADEAWFVFDKDGKFQNNKTGLENGKYIENGMIAWHPGFVKVDGEWYYFVADTDNGGNKLAQGQIYVTRNAEAAGYKSGDQLVFKDGKVDTTVNGITNGYYYINGQLVVGKGLIQIGDKYIFVRSAGQLAKGNYWVTPDKANGIVEGGMLYDFGTDGYLTINPDLDGLVNGVYYKEGVPYYAGLIEIEGATYYVKSNGEIVKGWYYVTKTNGIELETNKLFFDENGKMVDVEVKDGVVDGYYYKKGSVQYGAGLIEWNGDIYYVRSNGQVATGEYYITNVNGMEGFTENQKCTFGADGKLVK